MGDDGGISPPLWLMVATVAIYSGFFVAYGSNVFTSHGSTCDGLVSCTTAVFTIAATFFDFVTLGGFSSPMPLLVQGPLLLFVGTTWGIIVYNLIVRAVGAVIP